MKEKSYFKPFVYLAVIVYIVLTYSILALSDTVVSMAIREDQFFEMLSVVAFFVTALLFFYCFWLWRKKRTDIEVSVIKLLTFLGLGLLFIFGAGEEISWGQRYIGMETPQELMETNVQGEFNIHNLAVFEESDFFTADRIFDIFWFCFTFFVPLVCLVWEPANRLANRYIPVVHWSIGVLFMFNYLWAKAAKLIFVNVYSYEMISFRQAVQEIKESNYAVLFVVVGIYLVMNARQLETRDN
jgi:cell division protein FtsW (lipid II flippase)